MKKLIICECPSNEITLFGSLIIASPIDQFDIISFSVPKYENSQISIEKSFFECCRELGVNNARVLPLSYESSAVIIEEAILGSLDAEQEYDRIYTHSVQSKSKFCQALTSIVGNIFPKEVWTLSGPGMVDEIAKCDRVGLERLIDLINRYYSKLLTSDLVRIDDIKNVGLFQKKRGEDLYRFHNGCQAWHINSFDYPKPWALETSQYEQKRYSMEIEALHSIEWNNLIEIGACEGYFTQKLVCEFPHACITSVEPDHCFFTRLKNKMAGKVKLINDDLRCIRGFATDALFISNVLYYCKKIPPELFEIKARFFVVCHDTDYHNSILDKEFVSRGYMCIYEKNQDACIENMEEQVIIKYGFNLKIWTNLNSL